MYNKYIFLFTHISIYSTIAKLLMMFLFSFPINSGSVCCGEQPGEGEAVRDGLLALELLDEGSWR